MSGLEHLHDLVGIRAYLRLHGHKHFLLKHGENSWTGLPHQLESTTSSQSGPDRTATLLFSVICSMSTRGRG